MLTYEDAILICEKNESFKVKHQIFGNTQVAQFTYFLASTGDFFPSIIELEEDGNKIRLYGEIVIKDKKLKNMSDEEIQNLGFEFLSQFAFSS